MVTRKHREMEAYTSEISVRIDDSSGVRIITIPSSMNIVSHDIEPVNVLLHSLDIESLKIPFVMSVQVPYMGVIGLCS